MRRLYLLVLLLPCACHPVDTQSPVETYLSFLQAVRKGQAQDAYALLSTQTRGVLAARAKAVHALSGGAVSADPMALLFSQTVSEPPPTEVKLAHREGDRATLRVSGASGSGQVYLLNEAKGWRIDLTAALR